MRVTILNTGKSPRGFHDAHGQCIVVQPGQSRLYTLSEATLRIAVQFGTFDVVNPDAEKDEADIAAAIAQAKNDVVVPVKPKSKSRKAKGD